MNRSNESDKPSPSINIAAFFHRTAEEEARRFCYLAGWHHRGNTKAMLHNGVFVELPEIMVMYAQQITAERDSWRKFAEDLQVTSLATPFVIKPK